MKPLLLVMVCLTLITLDHAGAQDDSAKLLADAESLAKQYQDSEAAVDAKADLENNIRSLVEKSFDARQTSQLAQIEQMRVKLDRAEAAIQERASIRDRIVQRKVEDLLSGQSADWKPRTDGVESDRELQFIDIIGIGDVVAIHLDGVLPISKPGEPPAQPTVTELESGRIVMGYPFTVGADGRITLPLIGPINVAGMSLRDAEQLIAAVFVEKDILRAERALPTITLIPRQETPMDAPTQTIEKEEKIVIEPQSPRPLESSRSIESPVQVNTGVASFEDTYGRLRRARELTDQANQLDELIRRTSERLQGIEPTRHKAALQAIEQELESKKNSLDAIKFELQLERDYITDVIRQLDTDLQAKESVILLSQGNLERSEQLHRSGVVTSAEISNAQSDFAKIRSEYEIAKMKLGQYKNIADRWHTIVGDRLKANEGSEQSVDEGSGR